MRITKHAQAVNVARVAVDTLCVIFCWLLAYSIRFQWGIIDLPKGVDRFSRYAQLVPILVVSYLFVFITTGIYKRSLAKRRVWEENFDLARGHLLGFFVFVTLTYFFFDHRFSRVMLFLFVGLMPVVLPMGRSLVRKLNRVYLRRNKNKSLAIVVGSNEVADRICELIEKRADWNVELAGRFEATELEKVRALMHNDSIEVIFIAAGLRENEHLPAIYDVLGNTVAEVIVLPDFGAPKFLAPNILQIENLPAIALNGSTLDGYGRVIKRSYDFVFALLMLIALAPVFAVCALLVKLSSKGPVFYAQERMGLDGKTFRCLKFRGMYVDAETHSGPVWAKKDDDRTTAVGKWLRRSSLDEIPQFINVLRGEMSVVGPRPERPVFVQDFRHNIPGYMLRHKMKAGITGWAQINGWRGNTSLEKRIECDLWYIQNWSLWLDIKICLLTPLKGFVHPNAY